MADVTRVYAERIDAARVASNRGDRGEAERLLIEALLIGERAFGAEHPSLGTVLNELGRLYLRQSQHVHAREVLERLLRITQSKGEEHPDVATALTGLALAQRAMGDDAAAEERFRQALRIREGALAPQHMATVVTMEQLSETCAARGNVTEAIALLQRALPTREAALGADHATVRVLRTRIAELELRALASSFASTEPTLDPWMQSDAPTDSGLSASPAPSAAEAPATSIASAQDTSSATPHAEPARRPRRKRFAFLAFGGVAAVALATVGMTARSRADAADMHAAPNAEAAAHPAFEGTARSTSAAAPTEVTNVGPAVPSAEPTSSTGIVQAGAPMTDSAVPAAAPRLPRAPRDLAAVTAKLVARTNADSLIRASTKLDRELAADRIGAGVVTASRVDDAGAKPALLVGAAPVPRFPDELRSHWSESEVVVRFRVDEHGHVDVPSMKVLKSDHELFVSAVREVLPRFRFEPARSAAPEAKPIADWVDFRVRFSGK